MSTGSAIQVETEFEDAFEEKATGTHGPNAAALRQVAVERLAAHRRRRAVQEQEEQRAHELAARNQQRLEAARRAAADSQRRGLNSVREAVAARYSKTESYREYLAHEAERAIQKAQEEAEAAARSARAASEAQMRLIQEMEQPRPEPTPREQAFAAAEAELRGELAHALADIALGAQELIAEPSRIAFDEPAAPAPGGLSIVETPRQPPVREISASGLTVRLYEDIPPTPTRRTDVKTRRGQELVESVSLFETPDLDEEIDFRRAPEFEPIRFETTPIPGNLIEFPRELVAAKKARPRLAEGPLLEEPGSPQLRIFEVAPELPATAPDVHDFGFESSSATYSSYAPEWQNLLLDPPAEQIAAAAEPHPEPHSATLPLEPCAIERRLMAIAVDALCILGASVGFAVAAAWIAGAALQAMTLPLLAMSAAGTVAVTTLLFQAMFFALSESTPGMRFARVSFCTFADGVPSRKAIRRRVIATALAACPLGMGLLWMFLDEEGLGWHDRVTRMYLRGY